MLSDLKSDTIFFLIVLCYYNIPSYFGQGNPFGNSLEK